jgi:hypothetical protein
MRNKEIAMLASVASRKKESQLSEISICCGLRWVNADISKLLVYTAELIMDSF